VKYTEVVYPASPVDLNRRRHARLLHLDRSDLAHGPVTLAKALDGAEAVFWSI
jgi:hypothetical protein